MSATICPKCGYRQEGGAECLRCGVIFARYLASVSARSARTVDRDPPRAPRPTVFRVFRWVSIGILALVLILILIPSSPPHVSVSADAVARAEAKVQSFQSSLQKRESATLQMDESELNVWLGANLALKQTQTASGSPAPAEKSSREITAAIARRAMATSSSRVSALPGPDFSVQEVRSSVREVKIKLREDDLRGYVLFELYGKELSLELEGRLTVRDGCLTLDPTAGKLGSLPLPSATLQSAARRLFESPENKEKFRLPPEIRDVAIKEKRILISSR